MIRRTLLIASACFSLCSPLARTLVAQAPQTAAFHPAGTAQFSNFPNLPTCVVGAVQDGNPGTGPSILLLKFKAGCVIPWHWHTPNERLIVVTGSAKAEMKDGQPAMLKPGDFILLPSKHPHRFTAVTAVELYDISDVPFDIHYVDPSGKEIPAETALRAH